MATAMPKTADKKAAGARARASIVDATRDGVTVRVEITDELLGQLMRGRVDHLCRVTECVNPEHLELVTQGENVERSQLDRDALGRWAS